MTVDGKINSSLCCGRNWEAFVKMLTIVFGLAFGIHTHTHTLLHTHTQFSVRCITASKGIRWGRITCSFVHTRLPACHTHHCMSLHPNIKRTDKIIEASNRITLTLLQCEFPHDCINGKIKPDHYAPFDTSVQRQKKNLICRFNETM